MYESISNMKKRNEKRVLNEKYERRCQRKYVQSSNELLA